jgi:hypothetical protein
MSYSKYKQKYAFFALNKIAFLVSITIIQWALLRKISFKMISFVRSSSHWVPEVIP